ncbi:trigger factor [Mesorhizobium sp. B2-4-6]|nr:trigger factor [Mesorhizobium sp. B2-4-6]
MLANAASNPTGGASKAGSGEQLANTACSSAGGASKDCGAAASTLAADIAGTAQLNREVVPAIDIKDFANIKITRPVYDVPASEIDEQVKRVAEAARTYKPAASRAAEGDRVTINYVGKIEEAFSGGTGANQPLVLGAQDFIPGFEGQLIGAKAGDEKKITVTFPENYQIASLAGKQATFDVTVKEVAKPGKLEINDGTAKALGLESLGRLREVVRGQIENQFGSIARQKVKRQLLDQLAASYQFEVPSQLVEAEFNTIWAQVSRDLKATGRTFADEGTTEEKARADAMHLAERRIRLGLILVEVGKKESISVSDEELQRGVLEQVHRFPANQQQAALGFYNSNPEALRTLRASMFEDKVVDRLLGQISVTDKKVSKEELMAEDNGLETTASPKATVKKDAK